MEQNLLKELADSIKFLEEYAQRKQPKKMSIYIGKDGRPMTNAVALFEFRKLRDAIKMREVANN